MYLSILESGLQIQGNVCKFISYKISVKIKEVGQNMELQQHECPIWKEKRGPMYPGQSVILIIYLQKIYCHFLMINMNVWWTVATVPCTV